MSALYESVVSESGEPDGDERLDQTSPTDLVPDLHDCPVDPTSPFYSCDFGGVCHVQPVAVFRPTTTEEVTRVIDRIGSSTSLTLSPRGNGHSVSGQAMPVESTPGVVLDMSGLTTVKFECFDSNHSIWVGAGALWNDVLTTAIETCRMAPRSWVDYLGLTVGGTLSNGGVSGQAFRFGPQTSNVKELEVVTGRGDVILCSDTKDSDLFFAVLGGLGQFGVITRARIPLYSSPDMVRWIKLVYAKFEDYASDAELLVSRDETFDYIEGFVFINSDDPINGCNSVPFSVDQRFDTDLIPPDSGPVLYCLEVVLHYDYDYSTDVDVRATEMLRGLKYVPGLEFSTDVTYVEFLTRVKRAEVAARANGTWDAPHPWLNLFVSSADIVDFDRNVFKRILKCGIGGAMLVFPLLRSKWDPRTSVMVPDSEVFYLVGLLRFSRPFPDGLPVEELIAQNQEIVDHCLINGYDFKLYLPHYKNEEQWKNHFGKEWLRFAEMKSRYDPMAILAPGQRIFKRVVPSDEEKKNLL